MTRARLNGIEIDYQASGAGPAVLLSHGYSATRRMWDGQHAALEKTAAETGARITDRAHSRVLLELTADPARVDTFVQEIRKFDLKQLARTGPIVIRESDPEAEYIDPHAGDAGTHPLTERALSPQESAR